VAASSINITLPEPLKAYVEAQAESGDYDTPSDFILELILDDRDRRLARLEDRLLENLKSKPIEFSEKEFAQENFVDLCRRKLRENR
jgi:antitoxin ParD1/3/4